MSSVLDPPFGKSSFVINLIRFKRVVVVYKHDLRCHNGYIILFAAHENFNTLTFSNQMQFLLNLYLLIGDLEKLNRYLLIYTNLNRYF